MMRAEQRAEPKRLVLFGLGPHARRIYYPLIARFQKEHCLELALLVELEDKRKVVEAYIRSASMKPERVLYLPPEERKGSQLHPTFVGAARRALDTGLWGAVVSTEPRAHYIFSKWAIDNGLHVLVDKPVTAFDIVDVEPSKALRLVDEYFDLRRAADRARVSFLVQAHRRAHAGYDTLRRYLAAFVTEVQIPVTYIDLFHSDGMWNMPAEFLRENHPYKHGYGKILHSGYHFIDLFVWLTQVNGGVPRCAPDTLEVITRHVSPADVMTQVDLESYQRLFGRKSRGASRLTAHDLRQFGETDVILLLRLLKDRATVTSSVLSLLQTGFSRRSRMTLPRDTYKGIGRVRHERLTLQVGHLLTVQVHSYQHYDGSHGPPGERTDHFDIRVFRNSQLVGGEAFEVIVPEDPRGNETLNLGRNNESAKEEVFLDFITGRSRRTSLGEHELSVKLTAAAYYSILQAKRGNLVAPLISLRAGETGWFTESGYR